MRPDAFEATLSKIQDEERHGCLDSWERVEKEERKFQDRKSTWHIQNAPF